MFSSCCATADHVQCTDVDDEVRDDRHRERDWGKRIAVIGPAGTGKTTLVNQLTCLFGDSGLNNSELRDARRRPSIFSGTHVYDHLDALLAPSAYAAERQMLANLRANAYKSKDDDEGLRRLRNDLAGVVAIPSVRDYFEELRDWCTPSGYIEYTPDFDDLVRAWDCILDGSVTLSASELVPALTVRTDDIQKHRIEYDNSKYVIYDFPGYDDPGSYDRLRRRQWGFLFAGHIYVDAVVYPVNLADYNQCLFEGATFEASRSEDSRRIYDNLLSIERLANVPFFVVGTMHDRLQSKLHRIPFADFAPQLGGDSPPFDGDPLSADDVAEHRLSWYKEKYIYKSIAKLDPIPDGYRLLTVEEAREHHGLQLDASSGITLRRSFWLLDGGKIDAGMNITEGDFANDGAVKHKIIRSLPLFSPVQRPADIKQALRESAGDVMYEEILDLVCSYISPNPFVLSALDPTSVADAFQHIHRSMRMVYKTDDEVKEIKDAEENEIGDDEMNETNVDDEVNEIGDDEVNETGVDDEVNGIKDDEVNEIGDDEVNEAGVDDEVNGIGDDEGNEIGDNEVTEICDNEVNEIGVDEEVSEVGVERSSRSTGKRCVVM